MRIQITALFTILLVLGSSLRLRHQSNLLLRNQDNLFQNDLSKSVGQDEEFFMDSDEDTVETNLDLTDLDELSTLA